MYNLKEKSELLFNLYVWFYFLCAIKRKIVAANTKPRKKQNRIALNAACSHIHTHKERERETDSQIDHPRFIQYSSVCWLVCLFTWPLLTMGNSIARHVQSANRKERWSKNERKQPSRRWYVDGVFNDGMKNEMCVIGIKAHNSTDHSSYQLRTFKRTV